MNLLNDGYGRHFPYLRLSLTEACNFRCQYCLPLGYSRKVIQSNYPTEFLDLSEIKNLVGGLSDLGVKKVRLTGGEPTIRPDIVEIVKAIAKVPGISSVALTTNGYRLEKLLHPLRDAGLTAINISLDSLDERRFARITGSCLFPRVRTSVEEALSSGIDRVKLNAVLLRSSMHEELSDYLRLIRDRRLSVRFIELMETRSNREYFVKEYYSGEEFRKELESGGWQAKPRGPLDGPAVEFFHPEFLGTIGLISPYCSEFCRSCNRLRVSARGALKLCLFGVGEYPLRDMLQRTSDRTRLAEKISALLQSKPPSHRLHEGIVGSTEHLASIGG